MSYTSSQLEEIVHAIRNLWANCYQGIMLPGMSKGIGKTGARAYESLLNYKTVQMFGGQGTNLDVQAIITMGGDGLEEALRIQNGYAPYDMKPGFLASKNAKTYKRGKNAGLKYFVMGFRQTTPESSGTTGTPMTHGQYYRAKKGDQFQEQIGTAESPGEGSKTKKADEINIRAVKMGSSILMPDDYTWRNGMLGGLRRAPQDGDGKKHSGYGSFRVITPNSPQASWWHPGVDPNDVVGSVVKHVAPFVKAGLEQAFRKDVVNMINKAFNQ